MAATTEFSAQTEVGALGLRKAGGRVFGSDITNAITNVPASKKPTRDSFQPPAAGAAEPETAAAEVPVLARSQITAALCQLAISQSGTSDVQNEQEYVSDICNQFFFDEEKFLANPDYMETQTDITGVERTILIDWLVGIHAKYRLRPETLHLTVNLIDRYLTKMHIMSNCLLLVGVVAVFIASKSEEVSRPDSTFEEISPPELHWRQNRPISACDWALITKNACTKDDILVMEWTMLSALSFHTVLPTAPNFFDFFEKGNQCNAVHLEVARYLLELALLDLRSLQHKPSQMAASALLLSNKLFSRAAVWPAHMVQQTRHTEQSLGSCTEVLRELLAADRAGTGRQPRAVHKKFDAALRLAIAKMRF